MYAWGQVSVNSRSWKLFLCVFIVYYFTESYIFSYVFGNTFYWKSNEKVGVENRISIWWHRRKKK